MTRRDAIESLGLPLDEPATADQTKRAYLRKLREHSPERAPESFRRVREAYELVKDGWNPHDSEDADDGDHISDAHERGHGLLDLGHYRAHRSTPTDLDGHVAALLRHLAGGDVAAARACERARPDFSVARTEHVTVLRYVGARELLDLAQQLPASAVVAYASALVTYAPGAPSPALLAHWDTASGDARRALWILRHRSDSVLRELALAAEPLTWRIYSWISEYDQTWMQLALLGVAIVVGIILQQCNS